MSNDFICFDVAGFYVYFTNAQDCECSLNLDSITNAMYKCIAPTIIGLPLKVFTSSRRYLYACNARSVVKIQ